MLRFVLVAMAAGLRLELGANSSECIYFGPAERKPDTILSGVHGSWVADGPVDFTVYRKGAQTFAKSVRQAESDTIDIGLPAENEDPQTMVCWVNTAKYFRTVNFIIKESSRVDVASTSELRESENLIEDLEDSLDVLEVNLEAQLVAHDTARNNQEQTFSHIKLITVVEAVVLAAAAFMQLKSLKGAFATEVLI